MTDFWLIFCIRHRHSCPLIEPQGLPGTWVVARAAYLSSGLPSSIERAIVGTNVKTDSWLFLLRSNALKRLGCFLFVHCYIPKTKWQTTNELYSLVA